MKRQPDLERLNRARKAIADYTSLNHSSTFKKSLIWKKIIDNTNIITGLRSMKTPHEIEDLKITNKIAEFGLKTFKENADIDWSHWL